MRENQQSDRHRESTLHQDIHQINSQEPQAMDKWKMPQSQTHRLSQTAWLVRDSSIGVRTKDK